MGMGININNSPRLSNYSTTFMNKYLKKKIGINEIFRKIKNEFELYLNDNSW
jgi:biotin-(acetyl-CoA carboxylase) ligase